MINIGKKLTDVADDLFETSHLFWRCVSKICGYLFQLIFVAIFYVPCMHTFNVICCKTGKFRRGYFQQDSFMHWVDVVSLNTTEMRSINLPSRTGVNVNFSYVVQFVLFL